MEQLPDDKVNDIMSKLNIRELFDLARTSPRMDMLVQRNLLARFIDFLGGEDNIVFENVESLYMTWTRGNRTVVVDSMPNAIFFYITETGKSTLVRRIIYQSDGSIKDMNIEPTPQRTGWEWASKRTGAALKPRTGWEFASTNIKPRALLSTGSKNPLAAPEPRLRNWASRQPLSPKQLQNRQQLLMQQRRKLAQQRLEHLERNA